VLQCFLAHCSVVRCVQRHSRRDIGRTHAQSICLGLFGRDLLISCTSLIEYFLYLRYAESTQVSFTSLLRVTFENVF